MPKIIIHIHDGVNESEAMDNVVDSIRAGKVSETNGIKHYCHVIVSRKSGVHVGCECRRDGLYTFRVWRELKGDEK